MYPGTLECTLEQDVFILITKKIVRHDVINCSEPLCDVNIGCKAVDEGIIQKSTNIDRAFCCFFKKVMLLKCIYVDFLVFFFN